MAAEPSMGLYGLAHPMLASVCRRWETLLLRGIVAMALGIFTIARPDISLVSLVLAFGIFSLVDGIAAIILGVRGEPDGTVWWAMVVVGLLAVATGILTLVWPAPTGLVLLVIIASSAIARGIFEIVAAIRLRHVLDDEWVLGLSGAMSIIFGGLVLRNPSAGALAVALLIGAYMLAMGTLAVALALRLRKVHHRLTKTA